MRFAAMRQALLLLLLLRGGPAVEAEDGKLVALCREVAELQDGTVAPCSCRAYGDNWTMVGPTEAAVVCMPTTKCKPVPFQDSWTPKQMELASELSCIHGDDARAFVPGTRRVFVPDTSERRGDWCADEGDWCECPDGHVRYGSNRSWAAEPAGRRTDARRSIECVTDNFGDPAPGEAKTCECIASPWQTFMNFLADMVYWVEILILGCCICMPYCTCYRHYQGYNRAWKLGLLSKTTYEIDNQPSAVAERKVRRRAGCCWKQLFRWCLRCRNPEKRSGINNQEHLLTMHTMEQCGVDDPGIMYHELPPTIHGAAEVP